MNQSNSIVRRELTETSPKELRGLMDSVIEKMIEESCPCRYKSFIELSTFYHNDFNAGPVFSADTNYLIAAATNHPNYLIEIQKVTDNCIGDYQYDIIYKCSKCSSIYRSVGKQYSISFEFEYLKIEDFKIHDLKDQELNYPFLVYQGFFGFDDKDIMKCSKNFELGEKSEVFDYLIKNYLQQEP